MVVYVHHSVVTVTRCFLFISSRPDGISDPSALEVVHAEALLSNDDLGLIAWVMNLCHAVSRLDFCSAPP